MTVFERQSRGLAIAGMILYASALAGSTCAAERRVKPSHAAPPEAAALSYQFNPEPNEQCWEIYDKVAQKFVLGPTNHYVVQHSPCGNFDPTDFATYKTRIILPNMYMMSSEKYHNTCSYSVDLETAKATRNGCRPD